MTNPEFKPLAEREQPRTEQVQRHDFIDPHKAKERFEEILRAIGEVI